MDLIDRQSAIDALRDAENHAFNSYYQGLIKAHKIIADLPSAQPEPHEGHWIPHEDEDGAHYGDKCSECGEWYVMPYGKTNFCPNCGSDMRGGTGWA